MLPTLLDRSSPAPARAPTGAPAASGDPADAPAPRRQLCCAHCGHPITDPAQACSIDGAHEHWLTNPFGLQFRVRTFDDAPGARASGPLYRADSWFPQTAWQLATCGACGVHVGWSYEGRAFFWGLVADALVER